MVAKLDSEMKSPVSSNRESRSTNRLAVLRWPSSSSGFGLTVFEVNHA